MRTELKLMAAMAAYEMDRSTVAKLRKERAAKLAEARKALAALKQELDAELAEAKATLSQSRQEFNKAKEACDLVHKEKWEAVPSQEDIWQWEADQEQAMQEAKERASYLP